MQRIFQNAKRLISMCLVTLLIVTSAITMSPAPARADNDFVIVKCESDCGAAFTAGVFAGTAVTLVATGSSGGATAAGTIAEIVAIGQAVMTVAAPLVAAPAVAAAVPVVAAVAATGAVGYVGYRTWQDHQYSQAKSLN